MAASKRKLICVRLDESGTVESRPRAQTLNIVKGDTVDIELECINSDGTALNLTGGALVWAFRKHKFFTDDERGVEANITSGIGGLATVPLVPGHTSDKYPGDYFHGLRFIDSSDNRIHLVPLSDLSIDPAAVSDDTLVSVPPEQEPLAQGPPGESGGAAAIARATFDGATVSVDVTWDDQGTSDLALSLGLVVTDGGGGTSFWVVGAPTATGCTIAVGYPIVGYVDVTVTLRS